ncbi:anthranilate phosphoribosyltransferase [Enterococcus durans]|uniref:anthranilate phosphoribosyltransferase n=1 Tax=Enterococcus durans TaxID=53345 RepID=UPI0039A63689
MQQLFERIYQQKDLSQAEMEQLATAMFDQEVTANQISGVLIGLKVKGASTEELTGLAHVMQKRAIPMEKAPTGVMDNCGTGGDHSQSFNISTTAAFVLAGGGIPMAKHGNRSISSRSGSAEVLEALGVTITNSKEQIDHLLKNVGIAFLFAPAMHPAMRAVMSVRKELATPTIFNLIGPLINPYPLEYQLMGTYAGDSLASTAETLGKLGRKQALVLHGYQGMDEANLGGKTHCAFYQSGKVSEFSFSPEEVGLKSLPLTAITGGDVQKNKEILLSVLKGERTPYYETVLLNAGLGFLAGAKVQSIREGIKEAEQVIQSGAAFDTLQNLLKEQ